MKPYTELTPVLVASYLTQHITQHIHIVSSNGLSIGPKYLPPLKVVDDLHCRK